MFIHPTSSSLLCYPCFRKNSVDGLACKSFMAFKNFSSGADSGPPPLKYVPIEEVERLEKYQPSGYHPILIGDILQPRYRVTHKLGYGAYSTTWLCRDYQSNTYVAVKVGTADSNDIEVDVLKYLNHSSPLDPPGRTMIPSIKDRFFITALTKRRVSWQLGRPPVSIITSLQAVDIFRLWRFRHPTCHKDTF